MELDQIKKKLLEKFFEVSKERLQKMNSYILSLEKTPEDSHTIKELMREIHTLKGESR
jgi:two-component system chemotaxis sensor kinase CheA